MIRHWLYRIVMNFREIGPQYESGRICEVPECEREAVEAWMPSVCALREAGIKVDWVHVCAHHDVQMNEEAVRAAYGTKYDTELADYRARRINNDK